MPIALIAFPRLREDASGSCLKGLTEINDGNLQAIKQEVSAYPLDLVVTPSVKEGNTEFFHPQALALMKLLGIEKEFLTTWIAPELFGATIKYRRLEQLLNTIRISLKTKDSLALILLSDDLASQVLQQPVTPYELHFLNQKRYTRSAKRFERKRVNLLSDETVALPPQAQAVAADQAAEMMAVQNAINAGQSVLPPDPRSIPVDPFAGQVPHEALPEQRRRRFYLTLIGFFFLVGYLVLRMHGLLPFP